MQLAPNLIFYPDFHWPKRQIFGTENSWQSFLTNVSLTAPQSCITHFKINADSLKFTHSLQHLTVPFNILSPPKCTVKYRANTRLGSSADIYSKERSHRDEMLSLLIARKSAKDANISTNSYLSESGQNLLKWKSKQKTNSELEKN